MTIQRRNHGDGHSYQVDGEPVPGVTTILGDALPKPALIRWAGDTTAAYAVDMWDELGQLPPSQRLDQLKRARYAERDKAARRGTQVHELGARLSAGEEVTVPDELAGHVDAYVAFLNAYDPDVVLAETVVANRTVRYCGTLDLVLRMLGGVYLVEVKTSRSGIFGESALQACAYRNAEVWLDDDGAEQPMAALGICGALGLHVRADGYDLRPLETGAAVWATFRHLAWLQRRMEDVRGWVGPAMEVVA